MLHRLLPAALVAVLIALPAAAETGIASWYGPGFEGRRTASGERFDQADATCAHLGYAFGTRLRVTNLRNGKSAECIVNDRGPYSRGRIIDVSKSVAAELGMLRNGTTFVKIEVMR